MFTCVRVCMFIEVGRYVFYSFLRLNVKIVVFIVLSFRFYRYV